MDSERSDVYPRTMQISEELAGEAHDVMVRAFVVLRQIGRRATSFNSGLSPDDTKRLVSLSDALHDIPVWLHPDESRRLPCDEERMRDELARAKTILEML